MSRAKGVNMDDPMTEQLLGASALVTMVTDRLAGIQICRQNNLWGSALTIVYASIDNLASLIRPCECKDVHREDFIRWAEKYLLPDSGIPCTGLDLWGARCGILHSFSPESRTSRAGDAIVIYYAWNEATESKLEALIDLHGTRPGEPRPMAVHLGTLCEALREGMKRFLSEMQGDPAFRDRVLRNAKKMFGNISTSVADDWLSALA